MGKKFILVWIGLSILIGFNAQAKVTYLFDLDNTLFESRKEFNGSFQTKVQLYQVARRANTLQDEIKTPKVIEVSWEDFERIYNDLSKSYESNGTVGKKFTLSDGKVIEPANYYARGTDSFKYYYPGENGENYLIEDFKKALKIKSGNWKGPAWDLFKHLLSNPETAKNVGIITMRSGTKQLKEFFEFLTTINEGGEPLLNHSPNAKLYMTISAPQFDKYTLDYALHDMKLAKADVLENYIQLMGRTELKNSEQHYLVFAEDNQQTNEKVAKVFQKYTQNRIYPIKFGLLNAGNKSEVKNSGRPQFAIVEAGGTFRKATEEEVIGDLKVKTPTAICALKLLQVAGGK